MDTLIDVFNKLYLYILKAQSQIKASQDKEKAATEASKNYSYQIDQIKQENLANIPSNIKEKFFYVMIGAYDKIMIKFLTKEVGMSTSFIDSHSLEVFYYGSARFGNKFSSEVKDCIINHTQNKDLLKIYLNIINLMFYQQNHEQAKQICQILYVKSSEPHQTINYNTHVFNVDYGKAYVIMLSGLYVWYSSNIWLKNIEPTQNKVSLILAKT